MSNERLEVLGGLPLFEPLSPDERERLAAGCGMRAFAARGDPVPVRGNAPTVCT